MLPTSPAWSDPSLICSLYRNCTMTKVTAKLHGGFTQVQLGIAGPTSHLDCWSMRFLSLVTMAECWDRICSSPLRKSGDEAGMPGMSFLLCAVGLLSPQTKHACNYWVTVLSDVYLAWNITLITELFSVWVMKTSQWAFSLVHTVKLNSVSCVEL